ncbi:sushi, von Willebrand factor type A, EGF and pentraxin domain-containing protein 1-like isoform X3 [Branchiostoma lanceolatum]|uniref:sushi, von Willebrand factor type A, EGF and pentraxin domain-containing protein 1-like isoform X3 n=1 Tax=Branchiostoma lanceolatum TaxID=7740 RepID=UPI003453ED81
MAVESVFLLLVVLASIPLAAKGQTCPDGYSYNAGLCYRWTETLSFALDAIDDCASDGATLALPRSQGEHDYLTGLVSETILIGVTDIFNEGTWEYSDGTPIGAFNKLLPDADHPNTGQIDCVVMSKDHAYMWKPSSCSQQQYGYVCQKDADTGIPPLACPNGYSYNAGLCYRWTETLSSPLDAMDDCASDGSTLALPRSQGEHDYLTGLVSETTLIGVTDILNEGTWEYSDGTPIGAFNKFLPHAADADYPNTAQIDCVVMSKDHAYMWKPSSCSQQQYSYVCQQDADMTQFPQLECPAGYTGVSGTKCYRVVTTVDSAVTALAECQNEGADAVLPTSDLEHYYLKSLGLGTHWIGITDAEPHATEGNWVYITTGLPPLGAFNRWGSTANTDDLDCVTMDSTEAFQWAPTNCLDNHACVCQKDPPDQCPPLVPPGNGAVSGSSLPGAVATFSCDVGYNMHGASTTTCQADLTWSNTNYPTCIIAQCPPLSTLPHGSLSPVSHPYVYQDEVLFSCDTGYNIAGVSSITCQADGFWSDMMPTCNIVQCPLVTVQLPVIRSSGGSPYSYQDEVTFTCADGYAMDGAANATCQASGTWSDEVPTCNDIDACLATPCHAQATCTDNPAPALDAICECNTGYTGDGLADGNGCSVVQCPALTAPANGAVSGTNFYGDVATFTCDPGYNLVGGSTRTCQADTTWSGSSPTCTAVQCPALTAPANGAVSGTNFYGDVATFTCDPGYGLVGGSTRTCQADTTWSGSSPTCTAVQCPALTAPANGAVSGTNSYEDVATFTCDPGYSLVGGSTRTCQADTTWSGSSPTCTAVQCPALTAPANGAVSGTNFYGDVATFTCDPGYGLVGGSTRTCQADTTWSGSSPTCTAVQCPALTAPANGAVSGTNFYGDVATFTCDPGYNLVGGSTRTCQADATWSGSSPTCTDIDACLANPCHAQATCRDNPAPALDATCQCNTGYTGDGQADGTGCSDIDACLANPCHAQATCRDNPAPALDVTCQCNTGYTGDGQADGTGCSDIDACLANPCHAQATCRDNPAPALDAACQCNTGYTGDGQADGTGCSVTSECIPNPCQYGGTCGELSPSGYTCRCRSGYIGDNCQIGCNIKYHKFPVDQFGIHNGKCYWFSRKSDRRKYKSAETFCSSNHGGRLVIIKDKNKQSFLESKIKMFQIGSISKWIGLNDRGREKAFKWSDDSDFDASVYHNWRSIPTGRHKNRDCTAISKAKDSKWVLLNCNKIGQAFICELGTPFI